MRKIVARGIHYLNNFFIIASSSLFLPSLVWAEDDFIFEDEAASTLEVESTSDVANSALLNFNLPDNTHLLLLFFAVILAFILGIIFYRALLKSQITKGVHPREFFATIVFMVVGFFLLAMFFILINSGVTSLGWFTILAGLYLFFLIIFMAMGHLLKWILVVLVLIVAIIGFQLSNMDIF